MDGKLRLSGLEDVMIVDAGVFSGTKIANPILTVLAIGEMLTDMDAQEAG